MNKVKRAGADEFKLLGFPEKSEKKGIEPMWRLFMYP